MDLYEDNINGNSEEEESLDAEEESLDASQAVKSGNLSPRLTSSLKDKKGNTICTFIGTNKEQEEGIQ